MRTDFAILGLSLVIGLASPNGAPGADPSLYSRLGGKKVIRAVVNEFVSRSAADTRLSPYFTQTLLDPKHLEAFKSMLVDKLCQASGGPCHYQPKGLLAAPAHTTISEEAATALAEHWNATMDKLQIVTTERRQLLGFLGPIRSEIVACTPAMLSLTLCAPESPR